MTFGAETGVKVKKETAIHVFFLNFRVLYDEVDFCLEFADELAYRYALEASQMAQRVRVAAGWLPEHLNFKDV